MMSTGNDIVALKAINIARTKEYNFYKKIISPFEKELYDMQLSGKMSFENFVWLLWSVKESAYKYLQRITPALIFSPTKIIVNQLEMPIYEEVPKFVDQIEGCGFDNEKVYKGVVAFDDQTIYSRSIIGEGFIFSVVNQVDNFEGTFWGIQMISSSEPSCQSEKVRAFLSARLSVLFPSNNLQICKNQGCPILFNDSDEFPVPISLAHHEQYVAYSLCLNAK